MQRKNPTRICRRKVMLKVVNCGVKLSLSLCWGWTGWPPESPPKTGFPLSPHWLLRKDWKLWLQLQIVFRVPWTTHIFYFCMKCHTWERIALPLAVTRSILLCALGLLSSSSHMLIQACKQNQPSHPLQIWDSRLNNQRSCCSSSFRVTFSSLMYGKQLFQGQKNKKE